MPLSDSERERVLGLAEIERLQSLGMAAIDQERSVSNITDRLLALLQRTSDPVVSDLARLAHAAISTRQLVIASTTLASVNDQIATATNTFTLAARIAQEGEANLTFPFIAGKAASLLDLLKTLEKAVKDTADRIGNINGVDDLLAAFDAAKTSVNALKERAERLA